MIGAVFMVSVATASVSTAPKTLLEVQADATTVTLVERVWLTQTNVDTSENLGTIIGDMSAANTGGTAVVPEPLNKNTTAYPGVIDSNVTIEGTYTAPSIIEQGFNILSGFLWTPASDDEVIVVSPSDILGFKLTVAPGGTALNTQYGMTIRALGG